MTFARGVLGLLGLLLLAVGVAFLGWPEPAARSLGLRLESPLAVSDIRAVYGGLDLALGAALVYAACVRARIRMGLEVAAIVYGGLTVGRLAHVIVAGLGPGVGTLLGIEAGGLAMAALAIRRLPRTDVASRSTEPSSTVPMEASP